MPRLDTETTDATPVYHPATAFGESWRVGAFVAAIAALGAGLWLTTRDEVGVRAIVRSGLGALAGGFGVALVTYLADVLEERRVRRPDRRPTRLEVGSDEPPGRPIVPVTLDLVRGTHHTLLELDITPELQAFAERVMAWREDPDAPLGLSFAEASAGKVGVVPEEFVALRDEMMDRGLLRWKNPAHHLAGYQFRAGFDEAMQYVAEYPLPPRT